MSNRAYPAPPNPSDEPTAWRRLVDGWQLNRWTPHPESGPFLTEDSVLRCAGPEGTLAIRGDTDLGARRDLEFVLNARASGTARLSLWLSAPRHGESKHQCGYHILINNPGRDLSANPEPCQTGSLVGVRNVFKRIVPYGQAFKLGGRIAGGRIRVWIDQMLVVDYDDPAAGLEECGGGLLAESGGALALHWHGLSGIVDIHEFLVRSLPRHTVVQVDAGDEVDVRLARLQAKRFPLIDLHTHLKGITLDQALGHSLRTGINVGIAPNCGLVWQGLPGVTADSFISDDAGLEAFRASMEGQPVFLGMQGEGREWASLFSAGAMMRYDYVFSDCLTFDDPGGRRIRLWLPEEVRVDDPEFFMDWYVDKIVGVIRHEPLEIFANPTFLPECLAGQYDGLWTEARMDQVIEALMHKGIPLEINARFRVPSAAFIRRAKQAGLRFTFGTNNVDANLGRLVYCLDMIDSCDLTAEDIFIPNRI